jgi:hypothetical protein
MLQPYGPRQYYLLHTANAGKDPQYQARSEAFTYNIVCDPPDLVNPAPGGSVTTRRPIFNGNAGCPFVTVTYYDNDGSVNGGPRTSSAIVPVEYSTWSAQATSPLANGAYMYTATAMSDQSGAGAAMSELGFSPWTPSSLCKP